jgi:hypothetical protein
MKKPALLLLGLLVLLALITPFAFYYCHFGSNGAGLSPKASAWSEFGGFIGGCLSAVQVLVTVILTWVVDQATRQRENEAQRKQGLREEAEKQERVRHAIRTARTEAYKKLGDILEAFLLCPAANMATELEAHRTRLAMFNALFLQTMPQTTGGPKMDALVSEMERFQRELASSDDAKREAMRVKFAELASQVIFEAQSELAIGS